MSEVRGAVALKKNMKNPASFELVSALRMDDGTICYEYRGTNSFNAVITSFYVLRPKTGSASVADWNRYCAKKSGIDYSYAREAVKFFK